MEPYFQETDPKIRSVSGRRHLEATAMAVNLDPRGKE